VALFLLLTLWGGPVLAATYTVINTNDSGPGSLRQAMLDAQASAGDDEIVFNPATNGTPIVLASPLPNLQALGGGLSVTGNGAAATVISGDGQYRIFNTEAEDPIRLTLKKLTLHRGFAEPGYGGAIRFAGTGASSLIVDAVEFTSNRAYYGAAIVSYAPVVIRNSTFQGNYARTLATAMLIDNTSVQAENVTVSGNDGGGALIHVKGAAGTGSFRHLSMASNTAAVGLGAYGGASITLVNAIVTNSTDSGYDLEVDSGGTVGVANSVHNFIGSMSAEVGLADGNDGNQIGVATPLLGPLGNYGGPTRTLPLLPGSPALDAGTAAVVGLPATDQRGVARVGAPDIGAFESQGFTLSNISGGGQAAHVNTAFATPLIVQVTANAAVEPVEGGQVTFTAPTFAPPLTGPSATLGLATATITSTGRAQSSATANATVGGPYNVTAATSGLSTLFALTNKAAPGIAVSPTSGLVTTEAGGTATFTVVLASAPTANVSVPLASNDTTEGVVSPASLTFTPVNWNVAQTVTVTGVDDALVDGAVAYGITVGPSTSTDTHYNALSGATVAVSNTDNDFLIGGSVAGLGSAGLVLQNNGGDNLTLATGATSLAFATPLATGAPYAVTVLTQPAGHDCTVANGAGTVAAAAVTTVAVSCTLRAVAAAASPTAIPGLTPWGLGFLSGLLGWLALRRRI
jgi:hypothetical protein